MCVTVPILAGSFNKEGESIYNTTKISSGKLKKSCKADPDGYRIDKEIITLSEMVQKSGGYFKCSDLQSCGIQVMCG